VWDQRTEDKCFSGNKFVIPHRRLTWNQVTS